MTDWPLTFRCNNNCISCINNTKVFSERSDPSLYQIKKVIDRIDPKTDYLGLSGGEPTLRKEFFDILGYIKKTKPDMYLFIVTNGRMFAYRNFAEKLVNVGLDNYMLGVSLYAHKQSIHDKITQTKYSFKQTSKGIQNLLDLEVPVEIRTIINRYNYKHLPEIAKFVAEKFPTMRRMVLINMKYTGNAYVNNKDIMVKITDVSLFAMKAADILEKKGIETKLFHFPLCIVKKKHWGKAKGVTKTEKHELTFVKACKNCKMKNECPKIWKSYVCLFGEKEFKTITKQ